MKLAHVPRAPAALLMLSALAGCGGGNHADTATEGHEAPAAVTAPNLVLKARATLVGNVGAKVELRVGGAVMAILEVRATTEPQTYAYTVGTIGKGAQIDVVFTNDAFINGEDRNLIVDSMVVNGATVLPSDAMVSYDRGNGAAATDGWDVVRGQSIMYWGGALRFKAPAEAPAPAPAPPPPPSPGEMTALDAWRLADQATFGATESLVGQIRQQGAAKWVSGQMTLANSRYTLGQGDAAHKQTSYDSICQNPAYAASTCWTDWYSSTPLLWDFFRNATRQPDQLRQRIAFALQQILVVSELEVTGTYGLRNYHNVFLDQAFGNYREVLKKVALSPVMGDYLDHVNNDKSAPNENFAREMLQLFAVGTCELNPDGSLKGGVCTPTYDNSTVRNYAFALTGWTYPAGGSTPWGCLPQGANCRFYGGDMVPFVGRHDLEERRLLSGTVVPAGSTPASALELVLDSLMNHSSMAPFISRQLIQHLVTSNPSASYVQRVAAAFTSGRYASDNLAFGAGRKGDLAATVAAVLLDAEARGSNPAQQAGKLREPVLLLAGVLRALNGTTDGDALSYEWGAPLRQHVFRPPSVFNFYPPDYPLAGHALVAPQFGLHGTNGAVARLNYLTYLLYWGGSPARSWVTAATGTKVNLSSFESDAGDAGALVDRFSRLATGQPLPAATRAPIVAAVESFGVNSAASWKADRVRQAAYLVFASPQYQISR